MNREDAIVISGLLLVGAVIIGVIGLETWGFLSNQGACYQATITVTTVEVSNRKYIHTYVWTDQVVSDGENGMKSKQYFFADTPNFEVGKTYYVEWHNEIRFHPLDLFYIIGVIDSMEVISS